MANPQVLFLGQDLFAQGRVTSYPAINEMKSFKGDKLITNDYSIEVKNEDDFFSVGNPKSILAGQDYLFKPITVIGSKSEIIWSGIVTNIVREHREKTAIINSKNTMYKFYQRIIVYTSNDWETGAEAFKNICDDIGFTNYDTASVQASIDRLENANCYLKVDLKQEDGVTFQSIIEKLGEYSNADVYTHNNNIYFIHWIQSSGSNASIGITIKEKRECPIVNEDQNELINDYSIGYYGDNGSSATDTNSNNIGNVSRKKYTTRSLPEMDSSNGAQIVFKDKVSAIYIGESYMKRTHKGLTSTPSEPEPLIQITFELFADFREFINLQNRFKLTFSDENWTNKLFEIFEFSIFEDEDKISIKAYEVELI